MTLPSTATSTFPPVIAATSTEGSGVPVGFPMVTRVEIVPSGATRRTRALPLSPTTYPPPSSASIEVGYLSSAAAAGPPSPREPACPVPATVRMIPSGPTRRMRWLSVSAITNPPSAKAAMSTNAEMRARLARPPSPLKPSVPFPAATRGDRLNNEPRQMILGQPLPQARRKQQLLITITRNEVLAHAEIVQTRPDNPGLCDTLREEQQRRELPLLVRATCAVHTVSTRRLSSAFTIG